MRHIEIIIGQYEDGFPAFFNFGGYAKNAREAEFMLRLTGWGEEPNFSIQIDDIRPGETQEDALARPLLRTPQRVDIEPDQPKGEVFFFAFNLPAFLN